MSSTRAKEMVSAAQIGAVHIGRDVNAAPPTPVQSLQRFPKTFEFPQQI